MAARLRFRRRPESRMPKRGDVSAGMIASVRHGTNIGVDVSSDRCQHRDVDSAALLMLFSAPARRHQLMLEKYRRAGECLYRPPR